ncbi:hypothetical protein MNV49_003315 [Pseudohyphozyma bogoriensis]|nr:hypothetical protein MNV49_003315 [Pseudohyphozyma bogoriensis]
MRNHPSAAAVHPASPEIPFLLAPSSRESSPSLDAQAAILSARISADDHERRLSGCLRVDSGVFTILPPMLSTTKSAFSASPWAASTSKAASISNSKGKGKEVNDFVHGMPMNEAELARWRMEADEHESLGSRATEIDLVAIASPPKTSPRPSVSRHINSTFTSTKASVLTAKPKSAKPPSNPKTSGPAHSEPALRSHAWTSTPSRITSRASASTSRLSGKHTSEDSVVTPSSARLAGGLKSPQVEPIPLAENGRGGRDSSLGEHEEVLFEQGCSQVRFFTLHSFRQYYQLITCPPAQRQMELNGSGQPPHTPKHQTSSVHATKSPPKTVPIQKSTSPVVFKPISLPGSSIELVSKSDPLKPLSTSTVDIINKLNTSISIPPPPAVLTPPPGPTTPSAGKRMLDAAASAASAVSAVFGFGSSPKKGEEGDDDGSGGRVDEAGGKGKESESEGHATEAGQVVDDGPKAKVTPGHRRLSSFPSMSQALEYEDSEFANAMEEAEGGDGGGSPTKRRRTDTVSSMNETESMVMEGISAFLKEDALA